MRVTLHRCGPAVNESERRAFEHLKSGLIGEFGHGEWHLLTNLTFSTTHQFQSDEIDIVAIGPPGVRVIEVKHWTASWVDRERATVQWEADRAATKAKKIGTTLRKKLPELGRVDATFLVTEADAKAKQLEGRIVRGVRFHTLKTWRSALGFSNPSVLSVQQIGMLRDALLRGTPAVGGELERLAGYVQLSLQTPPDEHFHRVYKAVHSTRRDRVILHLYDLSARDDPKAENKARREFEALRRLQTHRWAPRILDSFQDTPGFTGESAFFTMVDPEAPNIEQRALDDTWETTGRLSFARDAVRAVKEMHEQALANEPMIHRNLTPETILVRHDNTPILTGFEYTRIPTEVTVATESAHRSWAETAAPELRTSGLGAADRRSDVYSLCASLAKLFEGREDSYAAEIAGILNSGMAKDREERSPLEVLEGSLSRLLGEAVPPPAPSARFWTEDQVIRFGGFDYRIISRLGSGGVGTTFKVIRIDRSSEDELGTYVAKVARDEEIGQRVIKSYKIAHSHLHHSGLSTIFEVASEWQENNFIALMSWIDGSPLADFAGVFPLLAEEQEVESPEALALQWLRSACEALDVLHQNGLVHGDVSPRNMIVSQQGLVLTDYDCVSKRGEHAVAPGTILYSAPSYAEGQPAAPADDLYALAASFFRVLFDKEPFHYDGVLAKQRGLNWAGTEQLQYPVVAGFLDHATHPDPEQRFKTTADAIAALAPARSSEDEQPPVDNGSETFNVPELPSDSGTPERSENEVLWLKSLLQSYPGSVWGNQETRGLDTDFAAETYVATNLERALYRDTIDRRVSLVVLCGNAGDGKTALLQHLAQRLELGRRTSESRILEGKTPDGLAVRMNLDGSASWQGRSSDDLLDEFMAPFRDGRPNDDVVHFLAINDGRLLEWLESEVRDGSTPLTEALAALLEGHEAPAAPHIRFENLNQRSLVGSVSADGSYIEADFLERLLDALYGGERAPEIWAPCETCTAQDRCEAFRATRLFGPRGVPRELPDGARKRARARLFDALQAVHLRGETHITVRELRAALVYILFGVHYCSDYHSPPAGGAASLSETYADRAFSAESHLRQGDVLGELVRFDPALEAHPQVDRYLGRPGSGAESHGARRFPEVTLETARRRAYFEWTEEDLASVAQNPEALGLARGIHLREFRDLAISGADRRQDLVVRVCRGISRLESLPPHALDRPGVVPLRITPKTPTETAFWAEKDVGSFRLEVVGPKVGEGVDWLHRQASLIYRYKNGEEEPLPLGADLFHLLLELSEGYQLGDVSSDDTFAHLSIFVQRLMKEDERRVYAWNPMDEDTIFYLSAKIIEEPRSEPVQRLVIAPIKTGGRNGE